MKKEKDSMDHKGKNSFEKDKIDLIKLRIRNKFYDSDAILEKVVSEILKKVSKKSP